MQGDLGRAAAFVTAEDQQLFSFEEIGQEGGRHLAEADPPVRLQPWCGQDRQADLVIKGGDLGLDLLLGQHVLAGAAAPGGQAVEEMGIEIAADAEGKDAHGGVAGRIFDLRQDGLLTSFAHGRFAVGDKHDHAGAARCRVHAGGAQGEVEGLGQGGAAEGLESRDELLRRAAVGQGGRLQIMEERLGLGGEADDLEAVAAIEVGKAVLQGFFRLNELYFFRHGAGGIEDEHQVFGQDALGGEVGARREHEEKGAGLAAVVEGQQASVDGFAAGGREKELEIGVRLDRFFLIADHGMVCIAAMDLHVVAGGVERTQG